VRVNCYKNPGDWYLKDFDSIYDALCNEVATTANNASSVQSDARIDSNSLSSSLGDAMFPIDYLVARDDEIAEIKEKFITKQFFLIYGQSGSGKTTLARHFIEDVRNDMTVWWISCVGISQRLQKLAEKVCIEKANSTFDDLVNNVRVGLGNTKFMFVLDNFDVKSEEQKNALRVFINISFQSNIKFLITAKSNDVSAMFGNNGDQLELKAFSKNDSLSLIRKLVDNSNLNDSQIDIILDRVEYLPIKVIRIVAKIKEMKYKTFEDLLREIVKDKGEYYENFKREHPLEYELIMYLSYLDGNSISIELIRSILINKDNNEISEVIKYLEDVAILNENEKNEYTIHESVQKEIQANLENESERKIVIDELILILNNLYDSNQKEKLEIRKENKQSSLITQIFNILEYESTDNNSKADLYNTAARLYEKSINYQKSLEYLEKALEIQRSFLTEKHPRIADSLHNIGVIYRNLGDNQKSIEYKMKALEIRRDVLPEKHVQIADSLHSLGVSYGDLGDHQKSIQFLEKALEIQRSFLTEKHPRADSLHNLGTVYGSLGDYQKSIEFLERALVIFRDVLPEKHIYIAESLQNLGASYGCLGDYQKSIEFLERALVILRDVLPEKHIYIAESLQNLGVSYGCLGDYQKSIEYIERALDILRDVLPEKHSKFAYFFHNLSIFYRNLGDYQKAIEYWERALEIRRFAMSEEHPQRDNSQCNLL